MSQRAVMLITPDSDMRNGSGRGLSRRAGMRAWVMIAPVLLLVSCGTLSLRGNPSGQAAPRSALRISPDNPRLRLNETITLRASTQDPSQRVVEPVIWRSSNTDVVRIQGGFGMTTVIEGRDVGEATITVTSANGLSARVFVRVRLAVAGVFDSPTPALGGP